MAQRPARVPTAPAPNQRPSGGVQPKRHAPPAATPAQQLHGKLKSRLHIFSKRAGMDLTFFILVVALVAIGLVMVFSASYANASQRFNNPYYFVRQQALWAVIGIILMIAISFFDYHHLHRLLPLFAIVTFVTLAITAVSAMTGGNKLVPNTNGAYRWINLGSFQFQPSEIAKFTLVLLLAQVMSVHLFPEKKRRELNRSDKVAQRRLLFQIILIVGVICGLVILEKHMSATIILLLIAAVMLFVGGAPIRWFVAGGAAIGVGMVALLTSSLYQHAGGRIEGWLNPFNPPEGVDTWQTQQSLYAIGSGRLLGLGLGNSRQKYMYLPEPQNDFIFAIVCEELGFIGALVIIILFGVLVWRGIMISLRAKDRFGMLLGIGLTMQVGLQVVLNIAVVTNTIPNTGISLPFFSYGGTSLVMLLAQMGIILSISRTSNIEKT